MDQWKPLQPTSIHSASTQSPSVNPYSPPPQATRSAPPAKPHPPISAQSHGSSKRRSLLPSWARGAQNSRYTQAPTIRSGEDPSHNEENDAELGLSRHIGIFPVAVYRRIMMFLSVADLAKVMTLSRAIAHVASDAAIWDSRVSSMRWISLPGVSVIPFESSPSPSSEQTTYRRSSDAASAFQIKLPAYRSLRSYKEALHPYKQSLIASAESPETSLLFTGPASAGSNWGPYEQSALLCNLLRSTLAAPDGPGLYDNTNVLPALLDSEQAAGFLVDILQQSASVLNSQLSDLFKSANDRRSDALRAAKYGATDTDRAVARAEGDLRLFATAIWQLGDEVSNHHSLHPTERSSQQSDDESQLDTPHTDVAQSMWFKSRGSVLDSGIDATLLRPEDNIIFSNATSDTSNKSAGLNFTPMDRFMSEIIRRFCSEGEVIAAIFPPEQGVLLKYLDKVYTEVIGEYILPLLQLAKSHSRHLYLRCCAAAFTQSLHLAEAAAEIKPPQLLTPPSALSHDASAEQQTSEVSHDWRRRFEALHRPENFRAVLLKTCSDILTEYKDEEYAWVLAGMDAIAERWETELENESAASRMDAAFLTSQNPAAVKRSVLTGFRDVLLLPVTVVPRTAVNVGGAVFRTAGKGVSHLNPLRWQGAATSSTAASTSSSQPDTSSATVGHKNLAVDGSQADAANQGYLDFSNGAPGGVDEGDAYSEEEDEGDLRKPTMVEDDWSEEVRAWKEVASKAGEAGEVGDGQQTKASDALPPKNKRVVEMGRSRPPSLRSTQSSEGASRPSTPSQISKGERPPPLALQKMQMLLSLDTALQMIHVNRDSLKRLESFSSGPDTTTSEFAQVVERVATAFFACIGDKHVVPGFRKAIAQIQTWKPAEHDEDATKSSDVALVEPLVHFFELVHVGDTVAQLVQVYFDQELSRHIDKTDFLNRVVREKKKFEAALDESVAAGLNAGVDLLMGQVEHLIATNQDPRDFYPEKPESMDLGSPTQACTRAVSCLQAHCRMLTGCADKNVLEVFWQEIALRLHSILCKHLKRQIISLDGGFKVIADLNAYHAFIATLKQPSLMPYFEALKMLGNVFIIEEPKELAHLVRDSSVFRGMLTPDDVYEFLQARCDFKAIEKSVDKEMYGFKLAEDCVIM